MPSIESGTYLITSHVEGRPPLGVPLTLPAFQPVLVAPGPAAAFKAVVTREGDGAYKIAIGNYPYTGIFAEESLVYASTYPDHSTTWKIEWREANGAYTISTIDGEKGWTVAVAEGGGQFVPGKPVGLSPLIATLSIPPQFLGIQLFNFEPYVGEE